MRRFLFFLLLLPVLSATAFAEGQWDFRADAVYTINRFGNTSAYIYQSGTSLGTSSLSAAQRFWWRLIPTSNAHCYHIQNATSGLYVQSTGQTDLSGAVSLGTTPVEFQIQKDETAGASTNGYYYLASTDQAITVASDAAKGLNYGGNGVVAYWIKSGRGNSYWEVNEGENLYVETEPAPEEEDKATVAERAAKQLGIFSIPCGTAGTYYLRTLTLEGLDAMTYSPSSKPDKAHVIVTEQKATVAAGGTLTITPRVAFATSKVEIYAYTDWDGDATFSAPIKLSQNKAETLAIPADAKVGAHRFRIRVTTTGTDGAEDDVIGYCYDFIVNVVGDAGYSYSVEVNDSTRGSIACEVLYPDCDCPDVLYLTATPNSHAKFLGWKRMTNDFQGAYITTEPTADVDLVGCVRVMAVFGLKTEAELKAEQTVVETVRDEAHPTTSGDTFDLYGRKVSQRAKGVVINNGKKHINK